MLVPSPITATIHEPGLRVRVSANPLSAFKKKEKKKHCQDLLNTGCEKLQMKRCGHGYFDPIAFPFVGVSHSDAEFIGGED